MKQLISLSIIILGLTFTGLSQPKFNDSKLAHQYYRNKEYNKAVVIFKSLYENSNSGRAYYSMYIRCLTELEEFDLAKKAIKKEIKQNPKELSNFVELGYIYEMQGEVKKANDKYKQAIKKLSANRNQIVRLSSSFRNKRKSNYAKQVLLKGRELLNNNTLFRNDLANVYLMEREYVAMIDEYLDWMHDNPSNMKHVKNRLQSAMYIDVNNDVYNMIKTGLISRIQTNPNETLYNQLLIWLYIQKKEFKKAFYQAKALDKRKQEDGARLMQLGNLAKSNLKLEVAAEIYEYITTKGASSKYYLSAKIALVGISYQLLVLQNKTSPIEMTKLELLFIETINDFGTKPETAKMMLDLAHIQAFYLDKTNEAKIGIEKIINLKGVKRELIQESKLELADILLFENDIWDAALLFGQVEKSNEENPIGHEAKFRKARLAYYAGNFLWAQAQLDVLKASTSKLIANDAFYLANLINENTALDTSETALMMFARADLLIYQNKTTLAIVTYDSIMKAYPNHSLADEIIYKKAEIFLKQKKYTEAIENFKQIENVYGNDILGDNAIFQLASIYDYRLAEPETAMNYYKKLITEYPGSIFIVEARKRFRHYRGDENGEIENIDQQINITP